MKKKHTAEYYMEKALEEAQKAFQEGEVPVGAVVVREGRVIAQAHNQTLSEVDPTAHAEISVLRKASRVMENHRLTGCDLYVTLEPCAMCIGAAVQARIKSVIFGVLDPKAGAVCSIMDFPFDKTNHRIETGGGILSEKCGKILKEFFEEKR